MMFMMLMMTIITTIRGSLVQLDVYALRPYQVSPGVTAGRFTRDASLEIGQRDGILPAEPHQQVQGAPAIADAGAAKREAACGSGPHPLQVTPVFCHCSGAGSYQAVGLDTTVLPTLFSLLFLC
jgi:hypothetical protein